MRHSHSHTPKSFHSFNEVFHSTPPLLSNNQLLSTSTLFSYIFLLSSLLSVLKSLDQASSFSPYMLHTPLLFSLISLSLATHRPQPQSRHLLTHLRGAQPQIINYGEGKLNPFHHSLKPLNVFSFWIYFLIL